MIKPRVRLIIIHQDKILLEYVTDEDFYFYPGGKVDPYETIEETATREMQEELATTFTFQKLLYIREFIDKSTQDHSIEFFILGTIDPLTDQQNPYNPDMKPNHIYKWLPISDFPQNVLPATLIPILQSDYKQGFPISCQYLGKL